MRQKSPGGSKIFRKCPPLFKILPRWIVPVLVIAGILLFPIRAFSSEKEKEEKIGDQANKEIVKQYGMLKDDKVQAYVRKIGDRLVENLDDPQFQYHFQVLDSWMINAFALPGGYVYITRGILAYLNDEAQLAVILGHEIGHVTSHHAIKQMKKSLGATILSLGALAASSELRNNASDWLVVSSSLSGMMLSGFGRENEMEADRLGMLYAYESGYDPSEGIKFFETLQFMRDISGEVYHGFMASHPDTIERIIQAEDISNILVARGGRLQKGPEEYLAEVNGLTFGEQDPQRGIHPKNKIEIYEVKEGENFRSIANNVMKNDSLALDVATLNGKRIDDGLKAGEKIKILVDVNQKEPDTK